MTPNWPDYISFLLGPPPRLARREAARIRHGRRQYRPDPTEVAPLAAACRASVGKRSCHGLTSTWKSNTRASRGSDCNAIVSASPRAAFHRFSGAPVSGGRLAAGGSPPSGRSSQPGSPPRVGRRRQRANSPRSRKNPRPRIRQGFDILDGLVVYHASSTILPAWCGECPDLHHAGGDVAGVVLSGSAS